MSAVRDALVIRERFQRIAELAAAVMAVPADASPGYQERRRVQFLRALDDIEDECKHYIARIRAGRA